jgi:hypothetical protein
MLGLSTLLNQLPDKVPLFLNYTYPYFFFISLIILIFLIYKNRPLRDKVRDILKSTPGWAYALLGIIVFIYLAYAIRTANPQNNLVNCVVQEVCQASNLYEDHMIMKFERTHGLASLVWIAKMGFPSVDLTVLFSAVGIIFGVLTILLLFLTVKYLTSSDSISLVSCFMYAIGYYTLYFSTSFVGGFFISSFFILMLSFFYISENASIDNSRLILFCTVLCVYFRIENLVLLAPLAVYGIRRILKRQRAYGFMEFGLAFVCLLPNLLLVLFADTGIWMSHFKPDGYFLEPIVAKLVGIYQNYALTIFSQILFIFLIIGLIVFIFRRRYFAVAMLLSCVLIYVAFQLYEGIKLEYTFNYIPLSIVFIAAGASWIYTRNNKMAWKIIFLALFIYLAFSIPRAPFSRIENDPYYVQQQIDLGQALENDPMILYTEDCFGDTWGRFYSNYTVVNPYWDFEMYPYGIKEFLANDSFGNYGYVVFPLEYAPDENDLEHKMGINLTEIEYRGGVAHLFRIE